MLASKKIIQPFVVTRSIRACTLLRMSGVKKIVLLGMLMLNASMHAMHSDDKTEADHIATLKAKAKAEKTAVDDEGDLSALGDPTSKSLIVLRDIGNKTSKQKKEKAIQQTKAQEALKAFAANQRDQANQKTQNISEFDKLFCSMPKELQLKIMAEYYSKTAQYVLRHKRELAPILYDMGHYQDASSVFDHISYEISAIKGHINLILKSHRPAANPEIWAYSTARSGRSTLASGPSLKYKQTVPHGAFHIAGYSDRTYNIYLNPEQLKGLMDAYSFDQISFLVSLAKIKVPEYHSAASIKLSSSDCLLFKNLDAAMQAWLEKIYWWINFYTPKDCGPGIDDRIECAHNKIIAYIAYWLRWVKELSYFCKRA